MVTELFDSLLADLGKILKIPNLHVDSNHACLIKFKEGVSIQLERAEKGEGLVMGCIIGNIPPGKYRENFFREALKANGLPEPRIGTFAYSKRADTLILYAILPLQDLDGEKIAAVLLPFKEKAIAWKDAIDRGNMPTISTSQTGSSGGGIFGLRP
ncbi:MAG: Tir chaperone family protein [Parachlamydia sp.]|nr:MAG: Tir chaperone family protein [Parachlamydia sp.]